jgi:hypothetical protein
MKKILSFEYVAKMAQKAYNKLSEKSDIAGP